MDVDSLRLVSKKDLKYPCEHSSEDQDSFNSESVSEASEGSFENYKRSMLNVVVKIENQISCLQLEEEALKESAAYRIYRYVPHALMGIFILSLATTALGALGLSGTWGTTTSTLRNSTVNHGSMFSNDLRPLNFTPSFSQYNDDRFIPYLSFPTSIVLSIAGLVANIFSFITFPSKHLQNKAVKCLTGVDVQNEIIRLETAFDKKIKEKIKANSLVQCTDVISNFYQKWLDKKEQNSLEIFSDFKLEESCQEVFESMQINGISFNYGMLARINKSADAEESIMDEMKRSLKQKIKQLKIEVKAVGNELLEIM